ncbi:MAG: hypothetical protein IKY44_02230 [Clostridia bacterium]|nr:hypothetical protein [Clostridia bacterium]
MYSHNHGGHRQRRKIDYLRDGNFDGFHPHEVLEFLLFYIIPQKDTNQIAHELLNRFGSLEAVLTADRNELMKVDGIKEEASLFLTVFDALERYRGMNKPDLPQVLNSSEKIIEYIKPHYHGKTTEVSMLICLDKACRVIGCHTILDGTINFTSLNPRKILDIVISTNAPCVVLTHNHPMGNPTPSQHDIETTRTLIRMLSQIEVKVLDHVIISPGGELSMAKDPRYMMMF